MADFYDISDWNEKKHYQTGGTRNKSVVENPETLDLYFFKTSLKKERKDYKYEFWSEIIASKVGKELGFNVLDYNIAKKGEEIGCLSKLMTEKNQSLFEGIHYLQGYDPNYKPDDKSSYNQYTFQFIRKALKHYNIEYQIDNLIKTIIFDSLIGNSDRHQENWGFIQVISITNPKNETFKLKSKKESPAFQIVVEQSFSPIYDSGSCLGREILDDKINQLLTDKTMLSAYINRGKSEIRWTGPKINHFELIQNIMSEHKKTVTNIIHQVKNNFDLQKVEQIVMNIDDKLPKEFNSQKMPLGDGARIGGAEGAVPCGKADTAGA